MANFLPGGMGWIPDLPDPRDYTIQSEQILPLIRELDRSPQQKLPRHVDLLARDGESFFLWLHDQRDLNCSSVCAVLSLVEYFERRIGGRTFDASKLFLYQLVSSHRNKGKFANLDAGADLRTTLKVLSKVGVIPEEYWPFDPEKFEENPNPFLFSMALPQKGMRFFRIDQEGGKRSNTWKTLKSFLAAGFPVAFGFSVPGSLGIGPNIPLRPNLDSIRGGQAAIAVGYEKDYFGKGNPAVRIRSSWGDQWGESGNGWMPVGYIARGLARDFWTLIDEDWLDSEFLFRPTVV